MTQPVIVNNPGSNDNNGMGFLVGIIVLIVFAFLFFYYGLPYLRSAMGSGGGPNINIPKDFNLNIQQKK